MKKKNKFLKLKKNNEIPTNDIKISVERTHSVPSIEINGQKIVGIQSFKIDYQWKNRRTFNFRYWSYLIFENN